MALINQLENVAGVTVGGILTNSNPVTTLLSLPPTVLKAVDKPLASIGDVLNYTVTITNVSLSKMDNVAFADKLPVGCAYVDGSFKVNAAPITPTVANGTLSYTIPTIAAGGSAIVIFQVTVVGGTV